MERNGEIVTKSLHAETLLAVGDRYETEIAAAKAAGMRAIGYAAMTPAPRLQAAGADAIATSMADVAALLAAESHW